jgi:hypothetical protein
MIGMAGAFWDLGWRQFHMFFQFWGMKKCPDEASYHPMGTWFVAPPHCDTLHTAAKVAAHLLMTCELVFGADVVVGRCVPRPWGPEQCKHPAQLIISPAGQRQANSQPLFP